MCAKKKVDEDQTDDDDLQTLEEFMDAYVSSYRSIISDMDNPLDELAGIGITFKERVQRET